MTRFRRWSWLGITACLGLAGCPPEPRTCTPGDQPTLEIGTGEDGFEPIPASGEVELINGPQGGYHTLIALQATHLDASALMLGAITGTIDGEVGAASTPWLEMACDRQSEALQAFGALLIWDLDFDTGTDFPAPEDLYGKTATVDVEVTDAQGTRVSAQTTIVIVEEGSL